MIWRIFVLIVCSHLRCTSGSSSDNFQQKIACLEKGLLFYPSDSQCYEPLVQGPCNDGEWLVLEDKETGNGLCQVNLCPGVDSVPVNGQCEDLNSAFIDCGEREWKNRFSLQGDFESVCRCSNNRISEPGKEDIPSPCFSLYTQGYCKDGQVLLERNAVLKTGATVSCGEGTSCMQRSLCEENLKEIPHLVNETSTCHLNSEEESEERVCCPTSQTDVVRFLLSGYHFNGGSNQQSESVGECVTNPCLTGEVYYSYWDYDSEEYEYKCFPVAAGVDIALCDYGITTQFNPATGNSDSIDCQGPYAFSIITGNSDCDSDSVYSKFRKMCVSKFG